MHLARAGQGTNHGSQPAAVNEHNLAQIEHDGASVAKHMGNVGAQSFDLGAGNQTPLTANDSDSADFACFQLQFQSLSRPVSTARQLHSASAHCVRRPIAALVPFQNGEKTACSVSRLRPVLWAL